MKKIIVLTVYLFIHHFATTAQNLLDANMQKGSRIVDREFQMLDLINDFGLDDIKIGKADQAPYDFLKVDSLSDVRDTFEVALNILTQSDKSKYEDSYLKIKALKEGFDTVKEYIRVLKKEGSIDEAGMQLIEVTTQKVDSLRKEQESVLSEIAEIMNPTEESEKELKTIPGIDGLQNNLAPNVKFVAASPNEKIGQIKGALFTGNNLNDEFNPEAFYNEGSSTYGFMTYGYIKFLKYIGLNGNVSLVEKSIKTPMVENAINMHYINTRIGLELAAGKNVAAFAGYNYGRPIDNLTLAKANINFQAEGTGVSQSYYNLGAVIQANLQPGSQDSRLTIEVNNIFLNKDLKETLNRPDDSGLLVIKLSLTKKL